MGQDSIKFSATTLLNICFQAALGIKMGKHSLFAHHVYKLGYRFADDVTTPCRTADDFMCVEMLIKYHILRAFMGMYSCLYVSFLKIGTISTCPS